MMSTIVLGEMLLGLAHAVHVRQLGVVRALLVEHLAQQAGVARIVLDQQNRLDRALLIDALLLLRQLDLGQPEIVDALHQALERVELHRLAEVAVRLELVALDDVRLRLRGGQDDRRNRLQALVLLDVRQHLAAVHLGQVEVQQDEIRARRVGVISRASRNAMASTPSMATCRWIDGSASRNASCVSRTSPGLSSTRRSDRLPMAYLCYDFLVALHVHGLPLLRQLGLCQPEIIDALDQAFERVQLDGLVEIAVRLELVAHDDIRFGLGGGQDDGRDAFSGCHPS